MLRVAVVGAGPSGVYTAQDLVAQTRVPDVRVHVLDRLPCPYGLVRYGVAPDHERIKSLQGTLRSVLEDERIEFLGHVEVGRRGLGPRRLLDLYHAVVYCVGASRDRRLGIPGEDLPGSHSATDFVAWYSAHPDAAGAGFDLSGRSAVVIGAGNVAVDVARMLARDPDTLRPTDLPEGVLAALEHGGVRQVWMAARRGPSQARFTTKELRELGALPGTDLRVDPADLVRDPAYTDPERAAELPAVARRNLAVVREWAAQQARQAADGPTAGAADRRCVRLRFFLRPVALLESGGAVGAVRFERTVPDGAGGLRGTGTYEEIEAHLVLRAVGYRGAPLPGLPFDVERGTVPHRAGRVLREGVPSPGEYVAGWIKRGPTGVIGSNRPCAKETVGSLLDDAEALARRRVAADPLAELTAAGGPPVRWSGWEAIVAAEAELGRRLGRGPVKIPDWAGLLAAAGG
ncbi:FAD-dependent oxidoreductase [Streptomyces sp. NPDC000594]|uniref:FAD-dependent oxidoreductase n=1 Tax=Streptomyces sp. NPDC000594 TaxID=3154261 RepID=UPI0033183927